MMNQRKSYSSQGEIMVFCLCGVSASGKTTIGERCAKHFNVDFIEGDDLHPTLNKELMSQGIPLDDAHRMPWLKRIAETIKLKASEIRISSLKSKLFVTCSALKRIYRDEIVNNLTKNERVIWVHLRIDDQEKLKQRMRTRKGHFMNENLIQSQFEALEAPGGDENVIELAVEMKTVEEIVNELINSIDSL